MILARCHIVRARKSRVVQVAGIEGLLEGQIRRIKIVFLQVGRQLVRHHDGVVTLIKIRQVAAVLMEAGHDLPAETIVDRQLTGELNLILCKDAVLPCGATYIGTRYSKEERCGITLKKVTKGISCEVRLKRKQTEIVGRQEGLDVEVTYAAHVNAGLHGVPTPGIRDVVCELQGLRLSYSRLVPSDWSEASSRAEIEGRKGMRRWMLADIDAIQVQVLQCCSALNRKIDLSEHIREAESQFIQQPRRNCVCMGNQQAAVVNQVRVVRTQR